MGLLNRMAEVLQRIELNTNVYEQKLAIIENCLYCSDILSIAAQITKLHLLVQNYCHLPRALPTSRVVPGLSHAVDAWRKLILP